MKLLWIATLLIEAQKSILKGVIAARNSCKLGPQAGSAAIPLNGFHETGCLST